MLVAFLKFLAQKSYISICNMCILHTFLQFFWHWKMYTNVDCIEFLNLKKTPFECILCLNKSYNKVWIVLSIFCNFLTTVGWGKAFLVNPPAAWYDMETDLEKTNLYNDSVVFRKYWVFFYSPRIFTDLNLLPITNMLINYPPSTSTFMISPNLT